MPMGAPDNRDSINALLGRCGNGDSAALRTLYDLVAPQLFSVLLRILHRADLAEDALQDVFLSIWRNATTFDARRGHPMAWMIGIARYRAIDIRRVHRFDGVQQELSEVEDRLVADSVELSAQADLAASSQKLADCMGQLSESQHHCIRLAFLDGLSHDEVAAKVASPIGTVKSWIRRGLLALRACLQS